MTQPHFITHNTVDDCAVAVLEGITKGNKCHVWIMDSDETLEVTVNNDIPIGHKVALKSIDSGKDIIKYGQTIGRLISPVSKGDHLHVHNLKTKRW